MFDENGDHFDSEMIELPAKDGRHFQVAGSDEVYQVDETGTLRVVNRDGVAFAGAKP